MFSWNDTDKRPTRRIWFGSLEDTVGGLKLGGRAEIKPFLLRTAEDHWTRVDVEEILYLEQRDGRVDWFTVRGAFPDLDSDHLEAALSRALKKGVFLQISNRHAVAPSRIRGILPDGGGQFLVETEGPAGDTALLPLERDHLSQVEECLEAMHLGGGFLMQEAEDPPEPGQGGPASSPDTPR